MKKIYKWLQSLSKRARDSISFSIFFVGLISTVCTVLGVSLGNIPNTTIVCRLLIVLSLFLIVGFATYRIIGRLFKDKVDLTISQTLVEITCGDIFEVKGLKVIGCDTRFHTTVDDVIIAKNSLHGKLVLEHGKEGEIKEAVKKAAERLNLKPDDEGLYEFPLGSVVRYDSSVDNQTYLMLAMTELNEDYEAHTNMAKYEHMLMKMWGEISRVYASNDVVLPILGDGITRFDDCPKDQNTLIRCMICTLNGSGKSFNSKINIVIYGNAEGICLYEFKDVANSMGRR